MDKNLEKALKEEYKDYEEVNTLISKINNLEELDLERVPNLANLPKKLEEIQELTNTLYNLNPSDLLIDVQVIINTYRFEYDITDPREVLHYDNGKGYVQ